MVGDDSGQAKKPMRPESLYPAFASVATLPGIGPHTAKLMEKLGLTRVVDLYWHLPTGLIDRRFQPSVAEAPHGRIATIKLRIDRHLKPPSPRLTLTLPTLTSAREVWFLVTGEAKRPVANTARTDPTSQLPAALVHRGARRATWFLDL